MPVKNRIKDYQIGGVYHIYNRGLDGREVFGSGEDFEMWLSLWDRYLGEWQEKQDPRYKSERPYILKHKQEMNLSGRVKILAYCLMPDHFHILVRQEVRTGITQLMRRMMTNYVMYYNRKNKRKGVLFENVYRAVIVPNGEKTLWLTKYIHNDPTTRSVRRFGLVETSTIPAPEYYAYSSYQHYLGSKSNDWLDSGWVKEELVKLGKGIGRTVEYKEFMENNKLWSIPDLGELILG